MRKIFNITKDELFDLYITKNMRRKEVALHYGCSTVLIQKTLQKFDIQKPFKLECKNKERKANVSCQLCGTSFETQKFRTISKKYTAKYCGYECSNKAQYLGEDHKRKIRNEIAARRRARIKGQTPKLTEEEKQRLQKFYLDCPKGYEVDHIKAIASGGLHHPDNLQILSMIENRKKWMK